jgi:hypothetical protein
MCIPQSPCSVPAVVALHACSLPLPALPPTHRSFFSNSRPAGSLLDSHAAAFSPLTHRLDPLLSPCPGLFSSRAPPTAPASSPHTRHLPSIGSRVAGLPCLARARLCADFFLWTGGSCYASHSSRLHFYTFSHFKGKDACVLLESYFTRHSGSSIRKTSMLIHVSACIAVLASPSTCAFLFLC